MKTLLRKRLSARCNILSIEGAHYEYQMKRQHKIYDQYIYRYKVESLSLVSILSEVHMFCNSKSQKEKKNINIQPIVW